MFRFLTPGARDADDPLASAKAVSAWLRELPTLDVIGRQQHVMRAFDAMRVARRPMDLGRAQALQFLDAALGADRRQLIKQYVENVESLPKLAERLWQAVFDMGQGFLQAYQATLEEGLRQSGNLRWRPAIPGLFARLVHYYGTDAKLRVFRYERWIPGKWMDLNRTFMRASELGVERVPTVLVSATSSTTQWTLEQEYIYVLLIHQLSTGNMSPAELDWAMAQLRGWSRRLQLESVPKSPEGFFVDLSGKAGLTRRTGNDSGSMLRYLDTTPLFEQLQRAIAALRQSEPTDQGPAAPVNQQRIAILERVAPAVAPNLHADLRRDARVACAVRAKVRVGFSRICQELTHRAAIEPPPDAATEHIEVYAVSGGSRQRQAVADNDTLAASLSSFSDPQWQVKDRSLAGIRIAASGGIGQSLALGGLVAVRESEHTQWLLGVVRRLNKLTNDDVEAGVSIIAERVVPVALHALRQARDDGGFSVDGIDVSTMGARFSGIYLPPPSRPDKPLSVKTLIIPTQEFAEGRRIVLTTGRSVYTVALRHLVEQRADWSWSAIQIVGKEPRS